MIKIKWTGGRFGNSLFLYTFARLVARKFQYKLATDLPENDILINSENPGGYVYENDPIEINDLSSNAFFLPCNLEKRLHIIHGYFQNINYYQENEQEIKSFFIYEKQEKITKDIVMHVRLTDYKKFGPKGTVIHPSFYSNILDKEPFDKVYIVTDEPGDTDYFKHFKKYNHEIIHDSAKNDFFFMMQFDRIISSNSTFSWWASFLGNASKIYTFVPWLRNCDDYYQNWRMRNSVPRHGEFIDY